MLDAERGQYSEPKHTKDLEDFQFEGTPINQTLVNDLASGDFIAQQRNAVLVGGTGTGKTHLAIAIARSCIRSGARGRFYNVVDLVNRLEIEPQNLYGGSDVADRGCARTAARPNQVSQQSSFIYSAR
jgi:DNA replication protein DnaC